MNFLTCVSSTNHAFVYLFVLLVSVHEGRGGRLTCRDCFHMEIKVGILRSAELKAS